MHLLDCIHPNPDLCAYLTSQSGIVGVMAAQQTGSERPALLLCYWFSIMSPVCCSNLIVSGDGNKAEQKGNLCVMSVSWSQNLWEPPWLNNSQHRCHCQMVSTGFCFSMGNFSIFLTWISPECPILYGYMNFEKFTSAAKSVWLKQASVTGKTRF